MCARAAPSLPAGRRRVILPRFLFGGEGSPGTAGAAGAAGNDDGDDGGGGIVLPIVEIEQQPGPFLIPATGPVPPLPGVPNGPFGATVPDGGGGTAIMYFNQFGALGRYDVKYRRIPLNPNEVNCNQSSPPVPDGDAHSLAGGSVIRNPATGLWAGGVNLTAWQEGISPGPGGNAPAVPGVRNGTAWTETGVQQGLVDLGGPVVGDKVSESLTAFSYVKILTTGISGPGYFVAGFLNSVPCDSSHMVFTYADHYTLVTAPTVFGQPARTQNLGPFTPDGAGGGSYAGNASRVKISFVAPGTTAVYFLTYRVTPTDGRPVYRLNQSEKLTVVAGAYTTVTREFPALDNATVFLESWEVLFNPESAEDWGGAPVAVFAALGGSGAWPEAPVFGGGGTWDDFENWAVSLLTSIYRLDTGYWNGTATFSSLNGESAGEDFEGYAPGPVLQLNRGSGWPLPGIAGQDDPFLASDDFEGYAPGPIALLPLVLDNFNRWSAAGTLGADQTLRAWDDFESYPAGAIASLPAPADPANHFGIGTFG